MKLEMKIPIKCPTCNNVMMTEYKGVYTIIKKCFQHNHSVEIKANEMDDEIYQISISMPTVPSYWVTWHILSKELRVMKIGGPGIGGLVGTPLPYFEPDLLDYPKLIEKIKTYLVFS